MIPSTPLSRMRLAGKLCRRGAWIIAAAGLAVIVFFSLSQVSSYQANPGQNFNDLLTPFALVLLLAISIFFFFLILFALGAFLEYMSTEKNLQEVNDEPVEITPLPKMP